MGKCPHLLYYDMDSKFAWLIYLWTIFDLLTVFALFVVFKTVYGGKVLHTYLYMTHRVLWLASTIFCLFLFIADLVVIFNLRFWDGLAILLKLVLTFDFSFNATIDFVQLLATVNIILDVLQLLIMILA